ncbi:MAG: Fe-S cluster assembly ATPase SufC [Verrucomicrobiota bacterium]|nr:MAG: Fe-S cluster assembly ATPase SufC [Verrucomicrobiota bacterium]
MAILAVEDLCVTVQDQVVLSHCNLELPEGIWHALMGKNGMGKSSLVRTIAGHPSYTVTSGTIYLRNEDITHLPPEERARRGLFLSYQNPVEIPGVSVATFLRTALDAQGRHLPIKEFYERLNQALDTVGLDRSFASRAINVDFSGGEKKRCEMLQILMLQPSVILLDEIDSGLDIDAIQTIAHCLPQVSGLIITHQKKFLDLTRPEKIHIMEHGTITHSGGIELLDALEHQGYAGLEER